jgi:hypothetical protein
VHLRGSSSSNFSVVYDDGELSDDDVTEDDREFGEWVFDADQWQEDEAGFSRGA